MKIPILFLSLTLALIACQPAVASPTSVPTSTTESATALPSLQPEALSTPIYTPTIPATVSELEGTILQPGFSILKFASLYRPTALTFDLNGNVFVASADSNIYILTDANKDGYADAQSIFASG